MSKKTRRKSSVRQAKPQDSVFKEAWENMNHDLSRVMPDFLAKRMQGGKKNVWLVVLVTVVEIVVLGVIGKLIYDWIIR